MDIKDLRELTDSVFEGIREEANKKGIPEVESVIQFDIMSVLMAGYIEGTEANEILTFPATSAEAVKKSILPAKCKFWRLFKGKPSDKIEDYSSDKDPAGLYFPIGTYKSGQEEIWNVDACAGIRILTILDPKMSQDLAEYGASEICKYFNERGFLTPEVLRRKTAD